MALTLTLISLLESNLAGKDLTLTLPPILPDPNLNPTCQEKIDAAQGGVMFVDEVMEGGVGLCLMDAAQGGVMFVDEAPALIPALALALALGMR